MTTTTDYANFQQVQTSEQFQTLRKTHRSFVFPMTVVFLIWYLGFVILAAFVPEFMAIKVLGNINLGIVLGLAQFVTTFIITGAYVSYANRKIDPIATDLREKMEASGATGDEPVPVEESSYVTTTSGSGDAS
ncbi:DUF485 domain-containing protein [Enteractinococcus helveticum]|uniref:DUF485 domain-containing protein n=1 Tax=Enteractinococcus helveticum TaxID=1837282 RepID=UPI0034E96653